MLVGIDITGDPLFRLEPSLPRGWLLRRVALDWADAPYVYEPDGRLVLEFPEGLKPGSHALYVAMDTDEVDWVPNAGTVDFDLSGVRAMLKALRRGEAIGVLPDQVPGLGEGEWVEFFGRSAYTMTLVARIAEQTGAPVLICYAERLPRGRGYRFVIEPLLATQALESPVRALNRSLEQIIRRCPQQYQWAYNRYKVPAGVQPPRADWGVMLTDGTRSIYVAPVAALAPGLMVLLASGLARLPGRAVAAVALLVLPLLFYQAHDRLRVFSSSLALWEDAAAKLPRRAVPGGSRTLYNLGREYLYRDRAREAAEVADRCLAEYPDTYDCHMARASIHLQQEEYRQALPHLGRAIALRAKSGTARHHLGVALENLGCLDEARAQYRLASKLGFRGADHRLSSLDSPGSGLLPAAKPKPRTDACDEPLPGAATAPRG